jgi:hypothetical protein
MRTVTGAGKVIGSIREGRGMETLGKELSPVMYQRLKQAYKGVKGEEGGMYPVIDTKEHTQVRLTGRQMLQRTIGPRTATELTETQRRQEKTAISKQRGDVLSRIVNAVVDGDMKSAQKLINQYHVMPTSRQIEEEVKRRATTRQVREMLKKPGKKEMFELQREGRIY